MTGSTHGSYSAILGNYSIPPITVHAFVISNDTAVILKSTAADRRMNKVKFNVQEGTVADATSFYKDNKTPNLIIVESHEHQQKLLFELEVLSRECVSGTSVIVVGRHNDIATYKAIKERGVDDYLCTPVTDTDVLTAISKIYAVQNNQKLGRVTVCMGARGGVGSSTIAQNIAIILADNSDNNVLIMDVDSPFGSAELNLNLEFNLGFSDILAQSDNIDEGLLDRASVKYGDNLRVICSGDSLDEPDAAYGPSITRIVEAIHAGAIHAIIDLPATWTEKHKTILKAADDIVIIACPDLISMKNSKKIVEYCRRVRPNDADPILVINKVGTPKRPELKIKDLEHAIGINAKVRISYDAPTFGKAANNGQTVYEIAPRSQATKSFIDIAKMIDITTEMKNKKRSAIGTLVNAILNR